MQPQPENRPKISDSPLSLVLIAHNDAASLAGVLADWRKVLQKRKQPFDIILVDDGSTDETGQRLDELKTNGNEVQVFRHESRRGFGAALRTGIAAARHPLLCYCTADRQYEPADLVKMLEVIDQVDLVAGQRVWQQAPRWLRLSGAIYRTLSALVLGIPLERRPGWLGWSGAGRRWLIRWVFGVFVYDPECAFRLCRREVLERLPIQADGSFASSEIIAKVNFLSGYIAQVPVTYHPPATEKRGEAAGLEKPSWREIRRVFNDPMFKTEPEPPASDVENLSPVAVQE